MIWKLSDGTVIHLGGRVEGTTTIAQELRVHLSSIKSVAVAAEPAEGIPFNPDDPQLLDRAIRNYLVIPANDWMMVRLLEAPEVEPIQTEPRRAVPRSGPLPVVY